MPRGRIILAGFGGWMLLLFTTQHLAAQSANEICPPQTNPQQGYSPQTYSQPGYAQPGSPGGELHYESGYGYPAEPPPPTGMDQIRQYPNPGPPHAPTHGFPNFDFPDRFFGVWFRSNAWGATKRERCAIPHPFRPRGFGDLFVRPQTSHRMDYSRPYLVDTTTEYGPSYYVRQPDPNCGCRNCRTYPYLIQRCCLNPANADRAAECRR